MAESARTETPSETPTRPGKNGGQLLTGNPGNAGGGRPPNEFKQFLSDLRKNPDALAALKRAVSDETLRSFGPAWKLVSEYDEDKPAEKKQHTGEVVVRVVRDPAPAA